MLLELNNVSLSFGGLVAVSNVSLGIDSGEMIGIVGPNGSGKTTLFNIISGVLYPDEGTIMFGGRDITRMAPYRRAPLGIGRTFQIPRPFGSASVRENIAVGALFGTLSGKIGVEEALEIADYYLDLLNLQAHKDKVAETLTPVEKKMLEIARALAMKPKLLLMDEAMAGMHPGDIDEMVAFIKRISLQENIAIVSMVEHIMRAMVGFAERVIVLYRGEKLVDAPTREALNDERVIDVYLGGSLKKINAEDK